MLAHVLAIAVGLSSIVLFLTAFSMSDIHQRDDFLWSGVGLFYALVLWFCASRITGSLLLGQVAAVALVISFNWQNLKLRKAMQRALGGDPHSPLPQDAIANPEQAMDTESFSLTELISGFFNRSSESNSQPNITQVLEEETKVDDSTPAQENPVSTATAMEEETTEEILSTTLGETDLEELTTEIQTPLSTPTQEETTEEISSTILGETDFEELTTEIQNPVSIPTEEISSTILGETDFEELTTEIQNPLSTPIDRESEDSTESTAESNLGVDTAAEPEIIVPTFEEEEEFGEIKEDDSTQSNFPNLAEETTEVEEIDETSAEEKQMDVKFTTSEIEGDSNSSIDDFLADLDNSIDKPVKDK